MYIVVVTDTRAVMQFTADRAVESDCDIIFYTGRDRVWMRKIDIYCWREFSSGMEAAFFVQQRSGQ
jgi:hypothetical protein